MEKMFVNIWSTIDITLSLLEINSRSRISVHSQYSFQLFFAILNSQLTVSNSNDKLRSPNVRNLKKNIFLHYKCNCYY